MSNTGRCQSCTAEPVAENAPPGTYGGYGPGCTSCTSGACSTRNCTVTAAESCSSNTYLLGCTTLSAGSCESCVSAHGAGCKRCSASQCHDRNCGSSEGGADACASDHYLVGCAASTPGTCRSCATQHGAGCVSCDDDVTCDLWNCAVVAATTCAGSEFLTGCMPTKLCCTK